MKKRKRLPNDGEDDDSLFVMILSTEEDPMDIIDFDLGSYEVSDEGLVKED